MNLEDLIAEMAVDFSKSSGFSATNDGIREGGVRLRTGKLSFLVRGTV